MTVGGRIRAARIAHGISATKLAEIIGKDRSTVYRYENGDIDDVPISILEQIAAALGLTPGTLMGWDDGDSNAVRDHGFLPVRRKRIPLLGPIAAGVPIFADEDLETHIATDYDVKCDFALKVVGDSMVNARINDGDIVFIREQPDVHDGEIAAVIVDDSATLKRVYHMPGGVNLVSENPKYPPMVFTQTNSDNVRIIGKVVAFQSYV